MSPGGARVRLGSFGAVFDDAAAELEGFARPLYGQAAIGLALAFCPERLWEPLGSEA